jgi:2-aminoethylphosphonate transport system ATP-binding protein
MTGAQEPAVAFEGVDVDYGRGRDRTPALRDLTLDIRAGETLALLGPSGSGKSTALKTLAGFLRPTAGRVRLAGRDVTDLPPARRGLGVVVQSYALFPHLRVGDNVAFGLRARRLPRRETADRVDEALRQVGMDAYAHRMPRELSGGQQQRVAIARALAIRPPVLLLDEPLAALDVHLRAGMLAELQDLRAALPDTTILFVTHDQGEALALADRIGVMRDGRLVDVDATADLWHRPPSRFTASFLGGANLLPATVTGPDVVQVAGTPVGVEVDAAWVPGDEAVLAVRPHALRLTVTTDGPDTRPARVSGVQWRGSSTRVTVAVDGLPDQLVEVDVPGESTLAPGARVGVHIAERAGVLVAPEPAAISGRAGT